MKKGVKFRIYPNKEQQNLINQILGCTRLVYNKGLALREEAFKKGEKIGYNQTSLMVTNLKKDEDFQFLKEAGYISDADISPSHKLIGLEELDGSELDSVQMYIDFVLFRKNKCSSSKEEL